MDNKTIIDIIEHCFKNPVKKQQGFIFKKWVVHLPSLKCNIISKINEVKK